MLLLSLIAAAVQLRAEVAVVTGDVSDNRTSGRFFAGLEVKLLLSGPELESAKGMRIKVASAADDTGKNLIDENRTGMFGDDFRPLEAPFGPGPAKKGEYEIAVKLANPPRAAKTFGLAGTVELLSPQADPASVVTADLAKVAGKPLADPALKAAGVEITLQAPKDDELAYKIKDPGNKAAVVEFCSADGKPLKTNGSSSMGFGATKSCSVTVPNLPAGVTVRIYLITPKSVVAVPVKLEGIKLP